MRSTLLALAALAALLVGTGGVALAAADEPAQVDVAVCAQARIDAAAAAKVVTDLGLTVSTAQAAQLRALVDLGGTGAATASDQLAKVNTALRLATAEDLACADAATPTTPQSPAATAPPLGGNVPDSTGSPSSPSIDGLTGGPAGPGDGGGQVESVPSGGVDTGDGSTEL